MHRIRDKTEDLPPIVFHFNFEPRSMADAEEKRRAPEVVDLVDDEDGDNDTHNEEEDVMEDTEEDAVSR